MNRQCFHCKQWIDTSEAHDCWTTTEAALTADLTEDLRDAYERLRETAVEFGDQRIYASHHSIMFSRRSCYFFVRPKRSFLELCVFLRRPITAPQIKKVAESSKTKFAHLIQVRHRDQVEAPITDWLREAYEACEVRVPAPAAAHVPAANQPTRGTKKIAKAAKGAKGAARPRRKAASPRASRRSSLRTGR
jgi:hypothetical protein